MKTLRMIGMVILAVLMCMNFTSCNNDDLNNNIQNRLIGTWKQVNYREGYYSRNWLYIDFQKDGICYYASSPEYFQENKALWSYSKENKMLRIYTEDGYYTYNLHFEFQDNGDWIGTENENGNETIYIYTKYE